MELLTGDIRVIYDESPISSRHRYRTNKLNESGINIIHYMNIINERVGGRGWHG
jgi:hypothetical protein